MFLVNHVALPYYVSGYALVLVERLFAAGSLRHVGKRFKDHLLMLCRILASDKAMPYADDKKKMDDYCGTLLSLLSDDANTKKLFQTAQKIVEDTLNEAKYDKQEAHRLKAFTADLVAVAGKGRVGSAATVRRVGGTLKWFSEVKGYGFIESQGRKLFVHARDVVGPEDRMVPGVHVVFTVIEGAKGPQAVAVEVAPLGA